MLGFSPLASGPLAALPVPADAATLVVDAQISVSGVAVTAPDIDAHFSVSATASAVHVKTVVASVTLSVTAPAITGGSFVRSASPVAASVSATSTAVLLPDPRNYDTKDVLSGGIAAAQRTASVTAPNVSSSAIKYVNAAAATAVTEPDGVSPLKVTVLAPDAASLTVTVVGYIAQFVELAGSGSIETTVADVPTLHIKSLVPTDTTVATTATISAQAVRIRAANLSGNNATIATTAPTPPTLLRLRGYLVNAAFNATVATVSASAFKGMTGTDTASVVSSAPLMTVIKSVVATDNIAVTIAPVVSTRHRLVSADVTGAATASAECIALHFIPMSAAATTSITASAECIALHFIPMSATATTSITATASSARAALMAAAASAVLSATANPRAIFAGAFQAAITAGHFALIFVPKLTPRTDAVVERYSRRVLPTGELRDVLGNEFQNIERTVASVTEATILVADAEPETRRKGMVRYAVTPWDPLSNGTTGLVVYNGNAWSAV